MSQKRSTLLVSALIALGLLSACTEQAPVETEEKLRPVKTMRVQASGFGQTTQFPGVVDAVQKATLGFRVSGKLETLDVKEGDMVKAGQTLATVDDTDFKIQLADRQASFDSANANFKRAAKLVDAGHVSRSDYDSLKATLGNARAQLNLAQQNVEHTELKAPFTGVIAKRYVDNFEEVSAQQVIFLLQDTTSLVVNIDVPESIMINSQRGREKLELFARFDAIPNEQFPLSIKEVATVADDVTQTYKVAFSMPAPEDRTILPGMSAVVSATTIADADGKTTAHFFLPGHAVLEDNQGNYVMLVKPVSEGVGEIERRSVTVGAPAVQGIEVLDGLSNGEQVVVAGMSRLSNGQRVKLSQEQQ